MSKVRTSRTTTVESTVAVNETDTSSTSSAAAQPSAPDQTASSGTATKRVLTIDDDARILQVLRIILESNGFQVECANSAVEGVEKVKNCTYDFILVDLKMPENDGLWFVRNAGIPRKTKVLLVTAYLDRNVVNEMFKCGIVGYVSKPFDEEEIMRHLAFHSQPPAV